MKNSVILGNRTQAQKRLGKAEYPQEEKKPKRKIHNERYLTRRNRQSAFLARKSRKRFVQSSFPSPIYIPYLKRYEYNLGSPLNHLSLFRLTAKATKDTSIDNSNINLSKTKNKNSF